MKQSFRSARITLWVNRVIMAVLAVLLVTMPAILDWFRTVRPMEEPSVMAVKVAFYCCAPLVALALWKLDKLLRNILREEVFIHENVNCIRFVRWCCLAVSLICLPAAWFYPPLVFMAVIMAFLSLVVNVVSQVMKAAVAIREENDLTV